MVIVPLSDIPESSFLGRFLRWWLKWIPEGTVVPVLQGPLRGAWWIVGAQTHGMWLGSYEVAMQRALVKALKPGQVLYDIGANVGFYSLLAARCVGPAGQVYAFEPLPRNLEYLDRHIRLNRISNITVVPCAVSDCTGKGHFKLSGDSTSHLSTMGELTVEVTTLDDFLEDSLVRPPDVMKVDTEGAEIDILRGAVTCLTRHHPTVLVAYHVFCKSKKG